MSEDDAASTYERLLKILELKGFGWVRQQIEENIAAGRESYKFVQFENIPSEYEDNDDNDGTFRQSRRKRRTEKLLSSDPFSSREKLLHVIEAIERATQHQLEIKKASITLLPQKKFPLHRVQFALDDGEGIRHEYSLASTENTFSLSERLVSILGQIKMELNK